MNTTLHASGNCIRTLPIPVCAVCGSPGATLYEGLTDQLFQAPGRWRMVRCPGPDCGLLWLDPAPIEDDIGLAYRKYLTHLGPPSRPAWVKTVLRWLKEGHYSMRFGYRVRAARAKRLFAWALVVRPGTREALDRLILHLGPRPGGRVLDVGCGDGASLAQLRDLGWEVEGVDFDAAAVEVAAARGLRVRTGPLEDQRFPAASFHAITLNHVIEHVPDPIRLLGECRRLLKPDGRLVLVTPNATSLGHRRFGSAWRGLEPPRHLHVFTARALEHALRATGLGIESLSASAHAAAYIHAESQRIIGGVAPSPRDAAARRFAREEQEALAADPWAGEELLLLATPC